MISKSKKLSFALVLALSTVSISSTLGADIQDCLKQSGAINTDGSLTQQFASCIDSDVSIVNSSADQIISNLGLDNLPSNVQLIPTRQMEVTFTCNNGTCTNNITNNSDEVDLKNTLFAGVKTSFLSVRCLFDVTTRYTDSISDIVINPSSSLYVYLDRSKGSLIRMSRRATVKTAPDGSHFTGQATSGTKLILTTDLDYYDNTQTTPTMTLGGVVGGGDGYIAHCTAYLINPTYIQS